MYIAIGGSIIKVKTRRDVEKENDKFQLETKKQLGELVSQIFP